MTQETYFDSYNGLFVIFKYPLYSPDSALAITITFSLIESFQALFITEEMKSSDWLKSWQQLSIKRLTKMY